MKLIAAACTSVPDDEIASFSRSSASTRMNMRPLRASSMTRRARKCNRGRRSSLGQPRDVARQEIDFEIELGAFLAPPNVVTFSVCGMILTPKRPPRARSPSRIRRPGRRSLGRDEAEEILRRGQHQALGFAFRSDTMISAKPST